MKQKTNQEVINAAFFALLTRNGVYLDYFCCWAKKKNIPYGMSIAEDWENWSKIVTPECYIFGAFVFDDTHIPECVWFAVHGQWMVWIEDNLKN